jgi:DDE superfamily endonuclease
VRRERWTHRELAERVGMSESQAHAILRAAELRPHLTEQWVMSELGPEFDAQAADVCGLYLDPPENAIVVSVDEKTSIAAREPARPDSPPAPGKPARRDSEYLRNGTQNLFAALEVHQGTVSGMTASTRNRWDNFIAFLDQLEAELPAGKQVIAILDNLTTHTTQEVSRVKELGGIGSILVCGDRRVVRPGLRCSGRAGGPSRSSRVAARRCRCAGSRRPARRARGRRRSRAGRGART